MFLPRLEQAIVRILLDNPSSVQPVGAGFLVSPHHLLTCAHVITEALSLPQDTTLRPTEVVHLDFPLLPQHPRCQAQVVHWCPVKAEVRVGELEDIAVLELITERPAEAQPVPLVSLESYGDHGVQLCGFPVGKEMGMYVNAKLQGLMGRGYVQLNTDLGHGQVAPGFSGTAVWDKQEKGIVGMVVSIDDFQGDVPAYMIPSRVLIQAYPALDPYSRPPNPYRGLAAFREQDAHLFFGREAIVNKLADLVEKQAFVAVIGASGSGKSSVVFAGLVPHLRSTGRWLITSLRPRTQPFLELATALVPCLYPDKLEQARKLDEFSRDLRDGRLTLSSIFQLIQQAYPDQRLLLIIDQFEELYTLTADKALQQRFIDVLLHPLPSPHCVPLHPLPSPHCVSLITLRADFMGQALAYNTLTRVLNQYRDEKLEPMTDQELTEIIERPATQFGVKLAEGLTQHILGELGREPGNLPLLEFALTQLWERQQYRQLTHEAYQTIGGVNQALAHHADAIYQQWTPADREKVRRVLVQLVRPGEGTEDTRQVAMLAQLPLEYHPLVVQLADQRLVVTGRDKQRRETVEVVHEALIRHWQPLREWMNADRKFRVWQNSLREAMQGWQECQQNEGALLYGTKLSTAEENLKRYAELLSAEEQAYIAASVALRTRQRQRERRNRRILLSALVLALVVVMGWLWREVEQGNKIRQSLRVAEQQRQQAEQAKQEARQQAQVSKIRQLDAQATLALEIPGLLNGYFDRALLLAVQAVKEQDNAETQGTLLRVVNSADKNHPAAYLHGHRSKVTSVAFSPDGKHLASSSDDKTIILWDVATQKPLGPPLQGHSEWVESVAFSHDGKYLASGSFDKTIILWNVTTQKLLGPPLQGHSEGVTSVAFSPDGKHLASGSWDDSIILWDVTTQQPLGPPLRGHSEWVSSVAFSPDGKHLASGSGDDSIILWDVVTQKPLGPPLQWHIEEVSSVAFSPDGKHLASGSWDKTIILWDVATQKSLGPPLQKHSSSVTSVTFSPDGKCLASGSEDKSIILWDVATQKPLGRPLQEHSSSVTSVAFSPDGKCLVSGSEDKSIILWDVTTQKPLGSLLQGHNEWVSKVPFSLDGKCLASGSGDKTVIFWNVATQKLPEPPLQGHSEWVNSVAFSPDGKHLASGSGDETIILWDVATQKPLGPPLQRHSEWVSSVAFSPDGKHLASGSWDKTIILWDVATQKPLGPPLHGHGGWVNSVAFSPDGKHLASGSWDKTIILWDVATQKPLGPPLQRHSKGVSSIAFSPDGKHLASGSWDKTIILWDVATQKLLGPPLQGHSKGVSSVAFSPDGRHLASGSEDKTIILWEVTTQKPLGTPLQGHSEGVSSVAFSSDGKHLASGSYDEIIILWDVATQKVLGSPLQGDSKVISVVFSPDGKWLVSGSWDSIILWDVDPQSWQRRACHIAGRNLTKQEWQSFMGDEPYRKTCLEYPSDEALTLINEGEHLAAQTESQDIGVTIAKFKEALAKFKEAFSLDPMLKEYPLYGFSPEAKARQVVAYALIDKGKSLIYEGISLAQEGKLEEAVKTFKRARDLGVDIREVKQLTVLLPFFSWLVNPKQSWKGVLRAIEQHPNLTISWDFFELESVIQRQEPSRQEIAQYFVDFWMKESDLETLKKQLGTK